MQSLLHKSGGTRFFVEEAYLQIRPVAVKAHPALVGDLCNLRQVVIFKLIQADVMGQPSCKKRLVLKKWNMEKKKVNL